MDPNSGGPGQPGDTLSRIVQQAQQNGQAEGGPGPTGNGRRVTLYRNGFTIDDGPLRDLDSPESKRFLAALAEGWVPQELMKDNKADNVAVELSDKRSEDYIAPPAPAYVAYSGEAMSLGRQTSTSSSIITVGMIPSSSPPDVNAALPVTTLQVKLISGKKVRIKYVSNALLNYY